MILSDTVKMKEYQEVSVICFECHLIFSSQFRVKLLVLQKSERPMTYRSVFQSSVHFSGRQALYDISLEFALHSPVHNVLNETDAF